MDTARASLSQGNKLAPELSSTGAVDLGDGWLDWLVARILLDEATGLITDQYIPVNNSRTQNGTSSVETPRSSERFRDP